MEIRKRKPINSKERGNKHKEERGHVKEEKIAYR